MFRIDFYSPNPDVPMVVVGPYSVDRVNTVRAEKEETMLEAVKICANISTVNKIVVTREV